jgi:hypothetical protein
LSSEKTKEKIDDPRRKQGGDEKFDLARNQREDGI